jgi:TolA-binding protein
MSDPERLSDLLDAGFERSLLEAAQEASAPSAARRRALSGALAAVGGLGAAAGAGHAAVQGAHAAAGGSSAIAAGVFKAFAIGLVSGAIVAGGAVGVERLAERPAGPARRAASAPPRRPAPAVKRSRPVVPVLASSAAPTTHTPPPPSRPATPSASAAAPSTRLAQEVAALDRARSALSGGVPRAALDALDDYAARFPDGALAPEATVLRIEALARAGDRARAAALARGFLARHPGGPLSERARRCVEAP